MVVYFSSTDLAAHLDSKSQSNECSAVVFLLSNSHFAMASSPSMFW